MKRLLLFLTNCGFLNNIFFNNLLLLLCLDHKFSNYINSYNYINSFNVNEKTLKEISGYSDTLNMNNLLFKIQNEIIQFLKSNIKNSSNILDIGCGPGLFLKEIDSNYQKFGIDITFEMLEIAKSNVTDANFFHGDFNDYNFNLSFDFIYSVGTIMYISKSKMESFANKCFELLNDGGYILISYPHAITINDIYYPDLMYCQYSPKFIEDVFLKKFIILKHSRTLDNKKIHKYDKQPFINILNKNYKTYENSSIIILKKK